MQKRGRALASWILVLIWMAMIFGGSTDLLSSHHTSRFIGPFLRFFKPDVSEQTVAAVQTILRKTGHLSEYALLALLAWNARRQSKDSRGWRKADAFFAIGLAAFYACTDEFHQSFVPTREASIVDVLIDTTGAALGIFLLWIAGKWRKRW